MSGGKGGSQSTEIPDWVRQPAQRNITRAEEAGRIGYTPYYGPSVAAFSPLQNQAFANLGAAGQAFGLAPEGQNFQPTMQPQDFGNGLMAHSSGPIFDLALQELQARRPGQFGAINGMFIDPFTGRPGMGGPGQAMGGQPQLSGNHAAMGGAMGVPGGYDQSMGSMGDASGFPAGVPGAGNPFGGLGSTLGGHISNGFGNIGNGISNFGGLLGGMFGGGQG